MNMQCLSLYVERSISYKWQYCVRRKKYALFATWPALYQLCTSHCLILQFFIFFLVKKNTEGMEGDFETGRHLGGGDICLCIASEATYL